MFKRVSSLILALIMVSAPLLSGVGTVGAASLSYDNIESLVAEQYDAFAKSLKPEGASEAVSRLVKHSIKSSKALNMKANDKFSAGLLNSKLFRASFIHAAAAAISRMLEYGETACFMRGGLGFYENDMWYRNRAYRDNENGNDEDDERISPSVQAIEESFSGTINTFDEGMILVVGSCETRFTFRQIGASADTITLKVAIEVSDRFDFNGSGYSGADKDLSETLTWIGRMLSIGLLNRFNWTVNAEMEIIIPNPCTHQSNNYRWEFDGKADLVSVDLEDNILNPLTRLDGITENGIFSGTYYAMDTAIIMYPHLPWSIEWVSTGAGTLCLADSGFLLRQNPSWMFFGESIWLNETDTSKTWSNHGMNFREITSVNCKYEHHFKLVNRIFADGSNMVYLFIDGEEVGPMNNHYYGYEYQGSNSQWLNGRILRFSNIGTPGVPLYNLSIDYIQVRGGGENPAVYDLCTVSTKHPTCAEEGKTTYTCVRCGAVFSESIPMIEHDPVAVPGTSPTCTESGLSEGSKCNSCGQILTEQNSVDPLGHSFENHVCTACGEREYVLGDVNLDGKVDVDDVLALLWHVLFPEEYEIEVDANFDDVGDVNVDDVLALLWHVLFPDEYPLN